MKKILIAPSILSADFSKLGEEIKKVEKAGADWVHIDVMDGVFVPNITVGPSVVKSIRRLTNLFFDVHLMIEKPERYIDQFVDAGSDLITFHIEACEAPLDMIKRIKDKGKKAGISIKPGTAVSALDKVLKHVDLILIMTVEPGFGGQSFMEDMLVKAENLKDRFTGYIEVDGGITPETSPKVINAGANVLVAGTAVFSQKSYAKAIKQLRGKYLAD